MHLVHRFKVKIISLFLKLGTTGYQCIFMETDSVSKRGTFVGRIQILGILARVSFFC